MGIVLRFPAHARASDAGRDSIAISRSSEISGKACIISGQASRGNWSRNFQARTAPGRRPTFDAKAAGPPFSSMIEDGDGFDMPIALPMVTSRGKANITYGNVTVGNVTHMATDTENGWEKLSESWERLIWARERWQSAHRDSKTASDAAGAMKMEAGTYRAYERASDASKHTKLSVDMARKFGRQFGVAWQWLLTGEGSPFSEHSTHIQRLLDAIGSLPEPQQKALADMAETMAEPTKTRPQQKRYAK